MAAFAFLYRAVLAKLVYDWINDGNYSHGFLIVPVAAYLVWERRKKLTATAIQPSVVGLVLLVGSLATLIAGILGAELFLSRVSMIGVLAGVVLFTTGWRYLRVLMFPLAFLLLMIPIPAIIFNEIAFPLQLLASRCAEWTLSTAHIPVLREGNIIVLANTTLEVAEACSGIRSLISLVTLAIIYGYFTDDRIWARVVLTLSGVATTTSVIVSCTPQAGAHQCVASASFSDGSSRVVTSEASWTSSNTDVATVDSSGRVAWISLTQFVRATVIVAVTDAVGVMIAASILQVQFVFAIGVLVFLGAFVPIVGAFVAGTVAVLVAFVDHGIVVALLMLGAVVLVQQIESHVLQPFLMGRFVAIHPLGIIVAIAAGILVAGIPGALVAVPFAAAANAVVQHLASETEVGEDPEVALEHDYDDTGQHVDTEAPSHPPGGAQDGRVGETDEAGVADQFDADSTPEPGEPGEDHRE